MVLLHWRDQVHPLKSGSIALVGGTRLICGTPLVGGIEGGALALERPMVNNPLESGVIALVGPSSSLGEWCYYIRETKFFPWRVTYSDTHI